MKKILAFATLLVSATLLTGCKEAAVPAAAAELSRSASEETVPAETTGETVQERSSVLPDAVRLDVENILQMPELPNGCEVVSLAIVLQYTFDLQIDPVWLSDTYMPKGLPGRADPEYTYVGDPKGNGFGCYVPCLEMTAIRYLADAGVRDYTAKDISGSSMRELKEWVAGGCPVILWATIDMEPSIVAQEWTIWGETVCWYSGSHCVVLSGYTEDTCIICDPLRGVVEYDLQDVLQAYELVGRRAMVLHQPQ